MSSSRTKLADMALAVEGFAHEKPQTFLDGLNSSDPFVLWYAIKGCGLKNIAEAVPRLVQILGQPCDPLGEDGNTDLRAIAAWSLGRIGFDPLSPYLTNIATESNTLLREGIADALGMTGDIRSIPILDRLMADAEPSVRLWAALSLSKLGESSLPLIEKHLRSSPDKKTAAYLLDALEKIDGQHATPILRAYLKDTPFTDLKSYWETRLARE